MFLRLWFKCECEFMVAHLFWWWIARFFHFFFFLDEGLTTISSPVVLLGSATNLFVTPSIRKSFEALLMVQGQTLEAASLCCWSVSGSLSMDFSCFHSFKHYIICLEVPTRLLFSRKWKIIRCQALLLRFIESWWRKRLNKFISRFRHKSNFNGFDIFLSSRFDSVKQFFFFFFF